MGALSQLFTGTPKQDYYGTYKPASGTPQGAAYDAAIMAAGPEQEQARSQQEQLASILMDQVKGGGPNLANAQLQAALGEIQAQQAGAIGSAKGINPQLAMSTAYGQGAQLSQQAAQQSAINRLTQQLAAQQQLSGVLGGIRGQDIGMFQGAGGLSQGLLQLLQQASANTTNANASMTNQVVGTTGQLAGQAAGSIGKGAAGAAALGAAHGAVVPGEAEVDGDSLKNDTVTAEVEGGGKIKVSPGEGIIPRSAMESPEKAAAFARDLVKSKQGKKSRPKGYGGVLMAQRGE